MRIDGGFFINDFINKNLRQYTIPVYQRNYEWSSEQCEKLFGDITSRTAITSPALLFMRNSEKRIRLRHTSSSTVSSV